MGPIKRTPLGKGGNLKESESVWVLLIIDFYKVRETNNVENVGYKSIQFPFKSNFWEEMSQNFKEASRWA
jgi:hypothetical protein